MKKLGILVMPLMAVSLLASCGSKAPVEHFVTFESYGGGHFPTQRVKDGEAVTPPTEKPIRGEDEFLGWFTDFDQPAYTFNEKVTDDITLYAGWDPAPNVDTYHFKFTGTNCSINGYKNEPFEITLPKGTQTQFQINPEDGYLFPTNDENHFKVIKGSIDGYDATKGLIKIGNMNSDIEIEAKSELAPAEFYTITIKAGENGEFSSGVTEISLKVEPNSNLLADLSIIAKPTYKGEKLSQTFNTFTYDDGSGIGADDKVASDDIVVKATYRNKTLEECSWKEIDAISTEGAEFAESFFGSVDRDDPITKTVMVNGQPHTVRIIGYGEDYTELPEGGGTPKPEKAISITFEFANLISDDQGYSLATQWNDTNDIDVTTGTANHNYLDSSVRMALVGEKKDKGHILWAQKEAAVWSTNRLYKNKSVLDMLPYELVSVLKTPSKYVNINDDGWSEQTVEDKLFLLSPFEMGESERSDYEEAHTTTYSYYIDAQDIDRVKKQVKNERYFGFEDIEYVEESGQFFQGSVTNLAGRNDNTDMAAGGYSWLRSPYISSFMSASSIESLGEVYNLHSAYSYALAVAPAFCI